jgi:hypothetical protein
MSTAYTLSIMVDPQSQLLLTDTRLPTMPTVTMLEVLETANAAPTLMFKIPVNHPNYTHLRLRGWVELAEVGGNKQVFRITNIQIGSAIAKVYGEGIQAVFNDTLIIAPCEFSGTPVAFIDMVLARHNAQAIQADGTPDPFRQIVRGTISDDLDPNNNIVRRVDAETPISTAEFLRRSTYESTLGGQFRVRTTTSGVNYLDWVSGGALNLQIIRYTDTLQSWGQHADVTNVATACFPTGARMGDELDSPRLTLDASTAGALFLFRDPDTKKDRYGFYNSNAVDLYGLVIGTNTWDDVTTPTVLLQRAVDWTAQQMVTKITVDATCVDKHLFDPSVSPLNVGEKIRFVGPTLLNIDMILTVKSVRCDYLDAARWEVSLGAEVDTLTSAIARNTRAVNQVSEIATSSVKMGEVVTAVKQYTVQLSSKIDQTAENIQTVLESEYVNSDNFNTEIENLTTIINTSASGVEADFNNWKSTIYVNDLGQETAKWDALNLWVRAGVNGVDIGRSASQYVTHVDDDEFSVWQSGLEVFAARQGQVNVGALIARNAVQVGHWKWLTVATNNGETFGLIWVM